MEFGTGQNRPATQRGFSSDISDRDLSSHLGPVASSGGLHITFSYKKVKLKTKDSTLNGKVETRLCVTKQPKGDRFTIATQFITEEEASEQFPREFAMFKQYEDVPTNGTSLSELPGMSQSQIAMFYVNGIRSVEDLVEVNEALVSQMGIEAASAQKLAKFWLSNVTDNADAVKAAEIAAAAEIERKNLLDRLDKLEKRNADLEADAAAIKRLGVASAATSNTSAVMEVESKEDLPDLADLNDDDVFGGEVVATGNDDLGGDTDPLAGE
jgi:hypothetical protein